MARRLIVLSLFLALLSLAVVVGAAATMVVAQDTGGDTTPKPVVTIGLTPSQGPSGTDSRIRVESRDPNQPVTLLIGVGAAIGTSTGVSSALGATVLEIDFTFFGQPGDVILVVAIIGNQLSGADKAFASFTITKDSQNRNPLQVSVSPSQGPDSTSTTVTVSGAAPGDTVQLLVRGQQSGQATAPASGPVTFSGVVMNGAPGDFVPIKAIAGVGASDPNATSGGTYFRILGPGELDPTLTVSLNPAMGPSGTRATLTVSTIRAGEGVTIFLPSGVVGSGATSSGTYTNTITFSGNDGDVIPVIVVVGNAPPLRVGRASFTIKRPTTGTRTGYLFGTGNDAQYALAGDVPQLVVDANKQPLDLAIDVALGDVTGDGEANLVLVVPNAPGVPLGSGRAFVLGNPAMAGYNGQRWSGMASDVFFGPSLGAILGFVLLADYDFDGIPDLFLSQPGTAAAILTAATNYTVEQLLFATAVAQMYLFFGGAPFGGGGNLADALGLGARYLINYGGPMAMLDWTGDGMNDILFGDEGSVGVIVGPVGTAIGAMQRLRFPGQEWFGKNIAGYGSFAPNGANCSSSCLGISAPNPDPAGDSLIILVSPNIIAQTEALSSDLAVAQAGTTFVDLSADDPNVFVIDGLQYGALGYDMAFGDLNGDGELDLVIGEPGAAGVAGTDPSDETGAVYVVLGPLDGGNIDEIAVRTYRGIAPGDRFGGGVAVQDVNDDGIPDIHVTAIGANGGRGGFYTFLGAAPVISGVSQSGDVLTISGANLDPNVFVDGQAATIVSYTPTEIQVFPAGESVEVRGAFGNASSALERLVELAPGWNLVGWTGATPVADATASIAGQFSTLFTWDAVAQGFLRFDAAAPAILNSLSELTNGDGVWIFVTDPAGATWTQPAASGPRSVDLLAGFNLVMWTGPDGTPVADAVAGIGDALNVLLTWDPLSETFLSYGPGRPDFLNSASTLNSGDGLWLDMSQAASWEQAAP